MFQTIILAAGRGSRISSITKKIPKPLIKINNIEVIIRLIKQLNSFDFPNITVVLGYKSSLIKERIIEKCSKNIKFEVNKNFEKDNNLLSLKKAINPKNKKGLIIFEADCIYEIDQIKKIKSSLNNDKSYWYSIGKLKKNQSGGIILNKNKVVKEIKIIKEYNKKYRNYKKLIGILKIGKDNLSRYKKYSKQYKDFNLKPYYLTPWINNLNVLKCELIKLNKKKCFSFNNIKELNLAKKKISQDKIVELVSLSKIHHIENYSNSRVKRITKKILSDKYWNKPLKIDKKFFLVMDGQHRMEAAKIIGLKKVPCILYDYKKVDIYSLRPKEFKKITYKNIYNNYKNKKIYPYKTAKHLYNDSNTINCKIHLKNLK